MVFRMSVFSKIKDVKQAAKQHKASVAVARHALVETKDTKIPNRSRRIVRCSLELERRGSVRN